MNKALGFGVVMLLSALPAWGQCPSADTTGDCFVDLADFTVLAGQWLTEDADKEAQDLALLAAQWLTGNRLPSDMILIPGGTFQMGNSIGQGWPDELPVHTVTVDSFAIGIYEITNGQYSAFLNSAFAQGLIVVIDGKVYKADSGTNYPYGETLPAKPYCPIEFSNDTFSVRTKGGEDMTNHPAVGVTWYGAAAYCNWRSQQEGREICYSYPKWTCDFTKKGYRLATEAEWEYAARGGLVGMRFPWGNTITHNNANYNSNRVWSYDVSRTYGYHPDWNDGIEPYTSPVGSFPANGFGLFDMAGNVREWCHDGVGPYSSDPQTNPVGPDMATNRVVRGGDWSHDSNYCRVSYRYDLVQRTGRGSSVGFRVVLKP